MEETSWRDLAAHEGDLVMDGAFRVEAPVNERCARALRLADRAPALLLLLDTDATLAAALDGPRVELGHPDAIELWAQGTLGEGLGFLITPEVRSPSLDDVLEEGPLEPLRVLRILRGVIEPLIAVHEAGFVLLNLRPQVIRVIPGWGDERVRIPSVPWSIGPAAGQPLLGYCAPEAEYEPTAKCDQFSLGVIAFELLTGFSPHNPDAPPGERTAIPALPAPGVPDALVPMLDKLLSHRIGDRYVDCRALLADLEVLLARLEATESSVGKFTPAITSRMVVPPVPAVEYEPDFDGPIVAPESDSVLGYAVLLLGVGVVALALSWVILQLW